MCPPTSRLIVCAMPRTPSRHRRSYYPYAPEFLSHFDAVLIRAANPTLDVPEHDRYVLDTRHADHARAEVLLRRYHSRLAFCLSAGRFPHEDARLKPMLTHTAVFSVRPTMAPTTSPRTLAPTRYLRTQPDSLALPPPPLDPQLAGFYLLPQDVADPLYVAAYWLPTLAMAPHLPVVLELPHKGEDASLKAVRLLRSVAACRDGVPPGAASGEGTVVASGFRYVERPVRAAPTR